MPFTNFPPPPKYKTYELLLLILNKQSASAQSRASFLIHYNVFMSKISFNLFLKSSPFLFVLELNKFNFLVTYSIKELSYLICACLKLPRYNELMVSE